MKVGASVNSLTIEKFERTMKNNYGLAAEFAKKAKAIFQHQSYERFIHIKK